MVCTHLVWEDAMVLVLDKGFEQAELLQAAERATLLLLADRNRSVCSTRCEKTFEISPCVHCQAQMRHVQT
jgi:hypothetical protein